MGRKSSQKQSAAWLDNDDTASVRSGNVMLSGAQEVLVNTESLLDRCLDALYEKRGSTREKALEFIIEAFNNSLQHEFAVKRSTTLLHQCLSSIKKGSAKELGLASHVIGLMALTTGPGEKALKILEDSVSPISEALRSRLDTSKISPLLACLAVITFVGAEEPKHTEKSMQIMWQVVAQPESGPNVAAAKPSHTMINMVVSAWSFLLTTMNGRDLNPKSWQEAMSYFSTLLDEDDKLVRIAAGEALASIFEKFCRDSKVSSDNVINQMRVLSTEASGRGCVKKNLSNQKSSFRDILDFIENGCVPETSTKIGGESINISSWSQLMQLNFLKHFLGGGFLKHMQENPFLHDVFGFTPTPVQEDLLDINFTSATEKRKYKPCYSAANKSRARLLKELRMISQQDRSTVSYDD